VRHTVLNHLIPPPGTEQAEEFEQDLRSGGYTGRIAVGRDLLDFRIPARE
jgi:ribonuclease Z